MKITAVAKSTMLASLVLSVAAAHANSPLLQANCVVDGKQAVIELDKAGQGRLAVTTGNEGYACSVQANGVEGPPFSDNATGMLVIDLAKASCEPAAAERRVQRNVFLHMADPKTPGAEAMAVIERRTGVFQCKVGPFNLNDLKPLLKAG